MKTQTTKLQLSKPKPIPEKYKPVALVPSGVIIFLWIISLACPNLIYSGVKFADTLHIIKWTVTGVPIAIALEYAGIQLMRYGRERLKTEVDSFGLMWLVLLMYCGFMPLWVKIQSPTAYMLEMVCFAAVWGFYVLSVSSFPSYGLRIVILLGNINASINVMFAELQIRNLNDFSFLRGTALSWLQDFSSIILPTPGNYIGNTAQQNMFGLWCAVSVLGAVYLFMYDERFKPSGIRNALYNTCLTGLAVVLLKYAVTQESTILGAVALILIAAQFVLTRSFYSSLVTVLMAVNFWGLMNSTSRSGIISLILGIMVLILFASWKFDRTYVLRFACVLLVLGSVFWASLYSPRSEQVVGKTVEIVKNAENIGNRRGIWMTSYAMFLEHPNGVGIGQYKWHYLEGQRYGFTLVHDEWYKWQYTHWAHNEFLQFFCEGGYVGGIMLIVMWLIWFVPVVMGLFRRERMSISPEAVWGVSLVTLITFCALFTRPFHRIENMVWITLAFAMSNREFLSSKMRFPCLQTVSSRKVFSAMFIVAAVWGVVYISGGIYGNYVLRKALSTQDRQLQLYYLNEAEKYSIVREEAQRNLGYHYIQTGEQSQDLETLSRGFNILWEHFHREPHSEDISRLLNFAQRFQIEPAIREIASYFKPGDYHLQRVPQKDSAGRTVHALLLMNGPGSNDR